MNKGRKKKAPEHHTESGFSNPHQGYEDRTFGAILKWVFVDRRRGQRHKKKAVYTLDSVENDGAYIRANHSHFTVTWAGHSTVLIQLDGVNILTDPVWSMRASPVPFAGPKRYIEPGISLDDLPPIDIVLLSHNHYDHFDRATIRRIGRQALFITPLGFGRELERLGIRNYRQFDWWETFTSHGIQFVCTPAQHYSSRRLIDRDRSLWSSWVGIGRDDRFFFAGDTGYFPGFREVGSKFGPFDLVCLPIGAYLPRKYLEHVHMSPEEALKAYHDLGGRIFLAIHWGTFNLGDDLPHEAPIVLMEEVDKHDLDPDLFWPLKHGETRVITHVPPGEPLSGPSED